jgi:hypothetical protein
MRSRWSNEQNAYLLVTILQYDMRGSAKISSISSMGLQRTSLEDYFCTDPNSLPLDFHQAHPWLQLGLPLQGLHELSSALLGDNSPKISSS